MSNIDLHRAAHQTMSEKGAAETSAYFASDIVYIDQARGQTFKGKAEATGWLAGWKTSFSDARVVSPTYLEAGEWTIAQFQAQGVNDGPLGDLPATGKPLDTPFCELLRWQDGHVVEGVIYYDTMTMLTQLGHMPGSP
jgi:steroid delta-isomerase-like uncharacterized protein